ncbi:type II toxin-antitoxin system Phd/YefM family antitoxin [Trichocoleus sp. DQ-A3]|uniref:type II toxin-antitoxin system Phd/YefM family antitoxin n=1 Tax=Cyanophyceae TaxID=3028117 RepID=UPI001685074C|nr:type II toxin-antitoxin system Phd/YefM family antitoxin [Coleofasciculus sp. FACHB-125]MBD1899685.1 type II toxin-antitoxin system Phd/YefM family antitoxin [Coleofasciculus sp. FACHB-125]
MTELTSAQAQETFSELITRVGERGERFVIEQEGQAVAAMISYADLKRFEALEDALDSSMLRRAIAENKEFVTLEEVIVGYNELHNTNLDFNSTLDE